MRAVRKKTFRKTMANDVLQQRHLKIEYWRSKRGFWFALRKRDIFVIENAIEFFIFLIFSFMISVISVWFLWFLCDFYDFCVISLISMISLWFLWFLWFPSDFYDFSDFLVISMKYVRDFWSDLPLGQRHLRFGNELRLETYSRLS